MTIASELSTLQTNLRNSYDAISSKGGTLPENKNYDNLAVSIESITGVEQVEAKNYTGTNISEGDKVWINQNSLDKFYSNNINYLTIGSLTVNNNIISDFSPNNYIQEIPFNPGNNTWEIVRKIHTGNDVNSIQQIFQSCSALGSAGRFGISVRIIVNLDTNDPIFDFYASDNGTSNFFEINGTYVVLPDTVYWVKAGFDGTKYYLDYSLDGNTFIRDGEYSSTTTVYSSLKYTFDGIYSSTNFQYPFLGSMDFSVGYNKINGVKVWTPYSMNVDDNTQTGIAAENIAAGDTGLVNVSVAIEPAGSITITENGTYDVTDYAEAVVNVASSEIELTAQSYVPQILNTGDKVWINSYDYEENSSRNVAPLGNSYLSTACVLPTPDSQVYYLWSGNSNLTGGVYRYGNKITNTYVSYTPIVIDWWGGCFVELGKYSSNIPSNYTIAIHTPTARYTYTGNNTQGYGAVYNAQWLYHWNSRVIDAIREFNVGDGTYNDITVTGVPANSFTPSSVCEHPAVIVGNYILIVCSNTKAILLEHDYENDVYSYVKDVTISGLASNVITRGFYGATSDANYLMIDNFGLYLGNVASGGNITTKTFSSLPGSNTLHFMTNGSSNTIISGIGFSDPTTHKAHLYSWNGTEGNFADLNISSTTDRMLIGVGDAGSVQVFATKSGSNYNTELFYPNEKSGYYLSSFADATANTVTGKAKGYFWYFGIGTVTVGGL